MKRRLVLAGLVFMGTALAAAPAAWAKGATQAVITGPGLSQPITLAPSMSSGQSIYPQLEKLAESSGFYQGMWGGRVRGAGRVLADPPAGGLGPRYTITYTMMPMRGKTDEIVQYVYPYAEPRPVTFMPPGQTYWGKNSTVGAWYQAAHVDLKQMLVSLGLPAAAPTTAPVRADGASGSGSGGSSPVILALVVIAVLLALAAVVTWRRREHPSVAT
jgi:hypothetical protein